MIYKEKNKVDQRLHYNIDKWKVKSSFDFINGISENITLVQLVGTVGNINHAVIIVDFIPTTKKALLLKI